MVYINQKFLCSSGNPDKCDYVGGSAMHHAAANNHMNCVTFLVSFGANIWSLDNDLHTPFDVAAVNGHEDIVNYLDSVINKQLTLNKKIVRKLKEKAVLDAQKRIRKYRKLQQKAQKRVQKQVHKLAQDREKMGVSQTPIPVITTLGRNDKRRFSPTSTVSSGRSLHSSQSEPKPYSAHVNTLNRGKKFPLTGVAKKLKQKSSKEQMMNMYNQNQNGDFKVGEREMDGRKTIRSLSGLKRDNQVMYVKNGVGSISSGSSRNDYDTGSNGREDVISRAISEPDFFYSGQDEASIFERPGFGSVSFINKRMTTGAMMSLPHEEAVIESEPVPSTSGMNGHVANGPITNGHSTLNGPTSVTSVAGSQKRIQQRQRRSSLSDSIGTVGSLAVRMKDLPWSVEDVEPLDDDDEESSPLELFLACYGLTEWFSVFAQQKIDLTAMMLLSDLDLKELGLPMGPRRKIMDAVVRRKQVLNNPGQVIDTHLWPMVVTFDL